jgi:hypothetical protein
MVITMTSTKTMVEQELVNEIASSLTEQLLMLYPNGSPAEDEKAIKKRLDGMLLPSDSELEDMEAMRLALPIAIEKWKASTPVVETEKTKSKSFSLFDQLLQLQPPVTFDQIKEAASSEARLVLCRKMDYLDDMFLADWNEIKPILLNELRISDNNGTKFEFLKLHRKFYDLGRSSSEYLVLQYELCQNVFHAIFSHIQNSNSDSDFLFSLIKTWCDMFLDIMQRDLYSQDLVEVMEGRMLFLLRDTSPSISNMNGTVHISPVHLLALADSQARWFQSWVQSTSLENLLSLLEQTSVFPDIIKRCATALPEKNSSDDSALVQYTHYKQSVVMLACVLEKARVTRFPWHLFSQTPADSLNVTDLGNVTARPLSNKSTTPNSAPGSKHDIDKMLDIFAKAISLEESLEWTRICGNALEAILSGCKGTDKFDQHFQRVNSEIGTTHEEAQSYWNAATCRLR